MLDWNLALSRIEEWAGRRESRYICICNVHSVVEAAKDSSFGLTLAEADMATPDGMPIAWTLRRHGFKSQQRINGPDLMQKYCERATASTASIYLYGGTEKTLELLQQQLGKEFPQLRVAGAYSPPFRPLTLEEDRAAVQRINDSGAGIVWVSLGCPKQEQWMARHRGSINAVMIGVGAAFDFHAHTLRRAPAWMQRTGLEWLHRFASEPRRLWKRYLITNTLFLLYALGWRKPHRDTSRTVQSA